MPLRIRAIVLRIHSAFRQADPCPQPVKEPPTTSALVTAFLRAFAPVADLLSETLRFLCPRTYEELEPIAACIPRDRRLLIEQSNFTVYRQVWRMGDVWLELGVQYATRGQGRCRP